MMRFMVFTFVAVLSLPTLSWAQKSECDKQAKTELEKVYCQVKSGDPQARLPTLHDFRRNPDKTQRLLLKRPAQKLGLSLPAEKSLVEEQPSPTSLAEQPKKQPEKQAEKPPRSAVKGATHFDGCELQGRDIHCGDHRFGLIGNTPNHKMSPGAVAAVPALEMTEFEGRAEDAGAVHRYLEAVYQHYIERMLALGLGASTMSYTKFYHTFQEVHASGVSFSERLAQMFEFLRKDKATIEVKAHYTDSLPNSLQNCIRLSKAVIVCDNVKHNWVYQRED